MSGTTEETDIIASAPNIINQDRGGDGKRTFPPGPTFNRDDNLGTSDYQGTGPGIIDSLKNAATDLYGLYGTFHLSEFFLTFMKQELKNKKPYKITQLKKLGKKEKCKKQLQKLKEKKRKSSTIWSN